MHPKILSTVIATNQGSLPWNMDRGLKCANKGVIFRPYKTWTRIYKEMRYLRSLLPQIEQIWISPGAKTGVILVGHSDLYNFSLLLGVECHKPASKMLLQIWQQDPEATFRFCGDRDSDQECAITAKTAGMPVSFEWAEKLQRLL